MEELLGPRKFFREVAQEKDRVGVATGLAWTENGGDIIFIETSKMKGDKGLILTGSLGEVMKESAQAALSYIRANAPSLNVPEDFYQEWDIHIHIPAGATPKDGPSAGITIATAVLSLLRGKACSSRDGDDGGADIEWKSASRGRDQGEDSGCPEGRGENRGPA